MIIEIGVIPQEIVEMLQEIVVIPSEIG